MQVPGEDSSVQELAAYRAKVQDLEAALTAQAAELSDATAKVNCTCPSLSSLITLSCYSFHA